jgi:inorganic pyrophosphatase
MDISKIGPGNKDLVNVFVESVKGTKSYYKYDKKMDVFVLKKILEVPFPGSYGFIPRTHHIDAKPMDAMIISSDPINKGIIVQAKPIGMIRLRSEIPDDVLIVVAIADMKFEKIKDLSTLNKDILDNLKAFLEQFKELKIENVFDSERAKKAVGRSIELHRKMVR